MAAPDISSSLLALDSARAFWSKELNRQLWISLQFSKSQLEPLVLGPQWYFDPFHYNVEPNAETDR